MTMKMDYYWPECKVYLHKKLISESSHPSKKRYNLEDFGYQYKNYLILYYLFGLDRNKYIELKSLIFDKGYIESIDRKKAFPGGAIDKHYWLGSRELFSKVKNGQALSIEETLTIVKSLLSSTTSDGYFPGYFSFELAFPKSGITKLRKEFDDYLTNFINGNLLFPKGKRFEAYRFQKFLFILTFQNLQKRFADNPKIYLTDIWTRRETISLSRFWELVFALEKEGYLTIRDLGLEGNTIIETGWFGVPFVQTKALPRLLNAQAILNQDGSWELKEALPPLETPNVKYEEIKGKSFLIIGSRRNNIGIPGGQKAKFCKALLTSNLGTPVSIDSLIEDLGKQEDISLQGATKLLRTKAIIGSVLKEVQRKIPKECQWTLGVEYLEPKSNPRVIKGKLVRRKQ